MKARSPYAAVVPSWGIRAATQSLAGWDEGPEFNVAIRIGPPTIQIETQIQILPQIQASNFHVHGKHRLGAGNHVDKVQGLTLNRHNGRTVCLCPLLHRVATPEILLLSNLGRGLARDRPWARVMVSRSLRPTLRQPTTCCRASRPPQCPHRPSTLPGATTSPLTIQPLLLHPQVVQDDQLLVQ